MVASVQTLGNQEAWNSIFIWNDLKEHLKYKFKRYCIMRYANYSCEVAIEQTFECYLL